MKQNINEIKRMQQLAGMIEENKLNSIELSDNEIRDAAIKYEDTLNNEGSPLGHFIDGAMWYREQLKNKSI
jgi:hypothetical protein